MPSEGLIELDGRTGEGGGQVVRVAIALASLVSKPVRITNVRGNRGGAKGGGLKSQHVTSIEWLAKATSADVVGLEVGSKTLEFRPQRGPGDLLERNIKIRAESPAASSLLILQAMLPFLLFAGNDNDEPVELEISGGTNVSFSLSYEYLDQVLLPTMESWFGIRLERMLVARGWSSGSASRGCVWFKIHPLGIGQPLRLKEGLNTGTKASDFAVKAIDVSIIAPPPMHNDLQESLRTDLQRGFPEVAFNLLLLEDSKHEARIYVLLVARSETLRWGRDSLFQGKRKGKTSKQLSAVISRAVTRELDREIQQGGVVDEYLQDQLVVFQALAEGRTSFPRERIAVDEDRDGDGDEKVDENGDEKGIEERLENLDLGLDEGPRNRKDRLEGALGDPDTDSTHTTTARWVASEVLGPKVSWFGKGKLCEGIGLLSG